MVWRREPRGIFGPRVFGADDLGSASLGLSRYGRLPSTFLRNPKMPCYASLEYVWSGVSRVAQPPNHITPHRNNALSILSVSSPR